MRSTMGKMFSRKFLIGAILVAAICAFLQGYWMFGGLPSQSALVSAALGVAAHDGLPNYAAPSLADSFNGWLWRTGGVSLLQMGSAAWGTLLCFAFVLIILLVVQAVVFFLPGRFWKGLLLVLAMLASIGLSIPPFVRGWSFYHARLKNLRLLAPLELDETAGKMARGEVFINPEGTTLLPLFAKNIAGSTTPEEASLVGNPSAWREALRKSRWKAVLLTGSPSNFRPLLEHLLTSPDWTLSALSNHGVLFVRGAGNARPAFDPEKFKLGNDTETAIYLAQISSYLDALHQTTEARAAIERAQKLAPDNPLVLSYAATFAAAHKHWQDAIAFAEKSLEKDPGFLQARVVKAMALLELAQPARAQEEAEAVLAQAPDDFYTLFLYARICRALNDYTHEADALERMIALCRKNGLPAGNYQLYLGQSYARLGMAKPALLNYKAALASGLLEKNQIDEVKDAIQTIESRDQRP